MNERIWAQNPSVTCTNCGYAGLPNNPYVKTEYTTVKSASGSNTVTSIKDYTVDKNGNVTEVREYDYVPFGDVNRDVNNAGLPTAIPGTAVLKRVTQTSYYNPATSTSDPDYYIVAAGSKLLNLQASTQVMDASSVTKSRSETTYDFVDYASSNSVAGNVTLTRQWDSTKQSPLSTIPLVDGNSIKTQATYNSYGMPVTTTDANNVVTQVTYANVTVGQQSEVGPYPTQTISAYGTGVARTSTAVYDFFTGAVTSSTDVDNGTTNVNEYDDLGRPTKVKTASGETGVETWVQTEYDDVARRIIVKSDIETVGDGRKVVIQHFDPIGRLRLTRTLEDPVNESPTNKQHGIKVQTRYRSNSFLCPWDDQTGPDEKCTATLTSNPYRANYSYNAGSEQTMGWTISRSQNNGARSESETYGGAAIPAPFVTSGANSNTSGVVKTVVDADSSLRATISIVTDQAGKQRRTLSNGLGQLIRVDEPTSSGLGTVSSPNQATSYAYNTLGNMIHVQQGDQNRYFMHDSLGRMLRVRQPEQDVNTALNTSGNPSNNSWTIGFGYDNNGNVTGTTDAKNVTITVGYDALNRPTSRTYSDSTPAVTLAYDQSGVANSKGRLTSVSSSASIARYKGYDETGR